MVDYEKSIVEQYYFSDGGCGCGYPVKNIVEAEESKRQLTGGGLVESIGVEKFTNYAIPIGLVSVFETLKIPEKQKEKRDPEVIPDDLFDKLFLAVSKQRKSNNKTKKNKANYI
jgi:hypothetical protein